MFESLSFSAKLGRLKECLGVTEDQEAAEALGLSKAALSLRKRRGSFPDNALYELAASRPALSLDVVYVLTGSRAVQARSSDLLRVVNDAVGSMDVDRTTHRMMVQVAVELAEQWAQRRQERAKTYEALLAVLDRASDESVDLVIKVATRMATADSVAADTQDDSGGADAAER